MSESKSKPQPEPTLESLTLEIDMAQIERNIAAQIKCHMEGKPYVRPKSKTQGNPTPNPPQIPKPKPSPWTCTKAILVLSEISCNCGSQFLVPASAGLLAHFEHKTKPDQTWEIAAHPSTLRADLPRSTRILRTTVEICQECLQGEAEFEKYLTNQGEKA